MKLVKYYKSKAAGEAGIGVVLALDDAEDVNRIGRENGFKFYKITEQDVEYLDVTNIRIDNITQTTTAAPLPPPRVAKKQARA